jgi:hypothetical protein
MSPYLESTSTEAGLLKVAEATLRAERPVRKEPTFGGFDRDSVGTALVPGAPHRACVGSRQAALEASEAHCLGGRDLGQTYRALTSSGLGSSSRLLP